MKRAHFYWSDTLFLLFKVPPTGHNAKVQTVLVFSDGPLQRRLGNRSQDVSEQLLGFVDAIRICGKNLVLHKNPYIKNINNNLIIIIILSRFKDLDSQLAKGKKTQSISDAGEILQPIKQYFRRMSKSTTLLVLVVVQFHQSLFTKHFQQHGQICLFCHSYCIARIRVFIEVVSKNLCCKHPHPNSYIP